MDGKEERNPSLLKWNSGVIDPSFWEGGDESYSRGVWSRVLGECLVLERIE